MLKPIERCGGAGRGQHFIALAQMQHEATQHLLLVIDTQDSCPLDCFQRGSIDASRVHEILIEYHDPTRLAQLVHAAAFPESAVPLGTSIGSRIKNVVPM